MNEILSRVPDYIGSASVQIGSTIIWPYLFVPAIIEALRCAGAVSAGGDLCFISDSGGLCECVNIGIAIDRDHLRNAGPDKQADAAAEIAMKCFINLGGRAEFLREGSNGFGDQINGISDLIKFPDSRIFFSWYVRSDHLEA